MTHHRDNFAQSASSKGLPEHELEDLHDYFKDCEAKINRSLKNHSLSTSEITFDSYGASLENSEYKVGIRKEITPTPYDGKAYAYLDLHSLSCHDGEFQTGRPDGMGAKNQILMAMEDAVRTLILDFVEGAEYSISMQSNGRPSAKAITDIKNALSDAEKLTRNIMIYSKIEEFKRDTPSTRSPHLSGPNLS